MPTTLDPAHKASNSSFLLTNGNLSFSSTLNGVWGGVISTTSKSSGKWWVETQIAFTSDPNWVIGLGLANISANVDSFGGSDTNSASWVAGDTPNTGAWYYNATPTAGLPTAGTVSLSAVVGVGLDLDGNNIEIQINGGTVASGSIAGKMPTGPFFFWVGIASTTTTPTQVDTNFGATTPTYAPPAGFTIWDGTPSSGGGPSSIYFDNIF